MINNILLLGFLLPAVSLAELTPEQALAVRQVQDPRISADGTKIAFTVGEPPKGTDNARNIWLYDVATGQTTQVTTTRRENSPRWSANTLSFLSNRSGGAQISTASGALTSHKGGIRSFEWSPDGKLIAFLASEPREREKDDAQVVGGRPRFSEIWIFDAEAKKERLLGTGRYDVSSLAWRPDGSALIVTATDRPELEQFTNRIFAVSLADGAFKEIAAPKGPISQVKISPDGSTISYVGARGDGPVAHDLYLVPAKGGAPKNLTGSSVDRPVGQYLWADNSTMQVSFEFGFSNRMYTVTTAGKSSPMPGFEVAAGNFLPMPGGGFAFTHESATELPELWLAGAHGAAHAVTKINENWASVHLVKPEFIRYKSSDGTEIEGALLKPAAPAGTKFPTVFLFHGGPIGRWSDRFDAEGQVLASHGYAVFYPNVRGATGYGHRFIDMILSEPKGGSGWGVGPFKDAMAAADALVQRGVADPNRLGIGGWSYGGYMSAWALGHTDRFKTAVAGAGVYDLFNDLGTEIASYVPGDEWNYGVFFDDKNREAMHKDSPITYVKNIHAPILLLHGEADPVDTIGQTYAFYRALKRYGATTEFVIYPREGHALREEKHLVDRLNRTLAWYDKYLKNAGSN